MSTEVLEHVFNAPTPAHLYLSNIRGEVTIRPNANPEDSSLRIHAVKHSESGDAENTRIEVAQEDSGLVRVETHYNDLQKGFGWLSNLLGGGQPCRVTYTLQVPHACSVEIHCVSSNAEVEGLQGSSRFDMVSGNLLLRSLDGDIRIKTISGNVEASGIKSSQLQLDSVSGDVELKTSRFDAVKAKSISGDFWIETPLNTGGYQFKTISGDVRLFVPPDSRCTIDASSISGRVHSDLPVTRRSSGSHQRVEVQGGGASIEIRSTSGDLFVSPSPGSAPFQHPDHPEERHAGPEVHAGPEPVSVPLTRQEILERIERGELSVDEGVILLQST